VPRSCKLVRRQRGISLSHQQFALTKSHFAYTFPAENSSGKRASRNAARPRVPTSFFEKPHQENNFMMKRFAALCATTALTLTAVACNDADTHDADVKAVQANEAQWLQDYATKDADKIVAHYTDDAVLIVPGTPVASGRDAIRTELKQMVADPALALKFQATKVDVAKSGDLAYTQGSYTLSLTDPQTKQIINDHGSYVTTYRKQADGSWKAVVDIVTSDMPPPASAPPSSGH
jgi:uncharacterized protein (TIGR02246 family)